MSFTTVIKEENQYSFRNEMLTVFNQKVELGLIRDVPGKVESMSDSPPELIFLLANHKPSSKKWGNELTELLKANDTSFQKNNVLIAVSSMMGYGLYESCMIPIKKYMDKYTEQK